MKFLIIHGIGGHAGIHWQGWLASELTKLGQEVIMPEMPEPNNPNRQEWLDKPMQVTEDTDFSKLVIIGHSLGVPAGLDLVLENNQVIAGLVSVSGFIDPYGAELNEDYLKQRNIDIVQAKSLISKKIVAYADNDPYVPQVELKKVANGFDVEPVIIPGGEHLNTDSGYTTFPELLNEIKERFNL